MQRAERNPGEPADGAPLHAAEADAPNRHDGLAQALVVHGRLRAPRPHLDALGPHRIQFGLDGIHEGVDVGEGVSGRRSCFG